MIAGKIENVDFEGDIRDFILMHHVHDLPDMTVSDLCSNPLVTSFLVSPTAQPCRPLKRKPLETGDLAVRKIPFDYEGNQAPLADVLVTRSSAAVKVYPVERGPSSSVSSHTAESVRFDQLAIDCKSPPAFKSSSDDQVLIDHATSLRVALAQDVAHAIARAYELRAAPKHPRQRNSKNPCGGNAEPENNGGSDASTCEGDSSSSRSSTSTTAQSNDVDDDEGSFSQRNHLSTECEEGEEEGGV